MKKVLLLSFFFVLSFQLTRAQVKSDTTTQSGVDTSDIYIYVMVDQPPVFKGDRDLFIKQNINYPEDALKKGIQGTVFVRFVVEKDGLISDVKIMKGLYPSVDQEALRIVNLTNKKWTAGKNKGKALRSLLTLPVKFKIGD